MGDLFGGPQGVSHPRRYDSAQVRLAVHAIDRLRRPVTPDRSAEVWTSREINGALVTVLDPVVADDVTRLLVTAFAAPPHRDDLAAFLAAIPADRTVRVAEPVVSHPVFAVRPIDDVTALAHWLAMSVTELDWFAARGRWSRRAKPQLRHYRVQRLPKRDGGFRIIEAPKERLATAQRRILDEILSAVPPHPAAHGFVRGRSVQSYASTHALHDTVVRVDLRRCFEHVTYPRVRAVFAAIGYAPAVAAYLASLCTTTIAIDDEKLVDPIHAALLRERHLPQGAPTSPALLNLVLRRIDFRIAGYAAKHRIAYTRYGDDLAFSGDDLDAGKLVWFVTRVAAAEGFVVHPSKTRIMHDHQRQQLGGLVVNRGVRSSRADFDALKALLHNAIRHGAQSQNRDGHPDFRAHVYGRIGWVSTGSPARRKRLRDMAARVDWES
ncbi:reverse transcriptase family protein [Gordonia phthalatica]|uniref:RNA-directed DNA polymerase n=1 Tax=Gordonia phthalatica TaxID=1136941 RepID=A0A0N9N0S9_9ACTN|nr:reverse transcriptase family protein [Gordonia phthalatica]ALG84206.1 DNA polymerase [Gordonia phthalatica]